MKKRNYILLTVIILIFIITVIISINIYQSNVIKVKEFDVNEFQYIIDQYKQSNFEPKEVGEISDAKTAVKVAKGLFEKSFPDEKEYYKKVEVFYDSSNEVWYVRGVLPGSWVGKVPVLSWLIFVAGGTPEILISRDGKVLACWHSQ